MRALTLFSGGDRRDFQGPKSDVLKFAPSMCERCNNAESQRFDRAWERFTTHLVTAETQVLRSATVDLRAAFGEQWRTVGEDAVRYVAKHLLCRIVQDLEGPIRLPVVWRDYLDGGSRPASFELDLRLDRSVAAMIAMTSAAPRPEDPEAADAGFVALGPLGCVVNRRSGQWHSPQSSLFYRWLGVYWRIGPERTGSTPFTEPRLRLRECDAYWGPGVRATFEALTGVPSGLLTETMSPVEMLASLRDAGYDAAADRLAGTAREAGLADDPRLGAWG